MLEFFTIFAIPHEYQYIKMNHESFLSILLQFTVPDHILILLDDKINFTAENGVIN